MKVLLWSARAVAVVAVLVLEWKPIRAECHTLNCGGNSPMVNRFPVNGVDLASRRPNPEGVALTDIEFSGGCTGKSYVTPSDRSVMREASNQQVRPCDLAGATLTFQRKAKHRRKPFTMRAHVDEVPIDLPTMGGPTDEPVMLRGYRITHDGKNLCTRDAANQFRIGLGLLKLTDLTIDQFKGVDLQEFPATYRASTVAWLHEPDTRLVASKIMVSFVGGPFAISAIDDLTAQELWRTTLTPVSSVFVLDGNATWVEGETVASIKVRHNPTHIRSSKLEVSFELVDRIRLEELAIVVPGDLYDEDGFVIPNAEGFVNLACARDALAKVDLFQLEMSRDVSDDLHRDKRSAALKMLTANYCMSGHYTASGRDITWKRGAVYSKNVEAMWTEQGAVCVGKRNRVFRTMLPFPVVFPGMCIDAAGNHCTDESSFNAAVIRECRDSPPTPRDKDRDNPSRTIQDCDGTQSAFFTSEISPRHP